MAGVRLDRITKYYQKEMAALRNISLDVADGEFLVLVGPSGCGKSTTLRIIAGLEEPNDGAVHIGERDVTQLEPKDRNVAMVFQNYALYPHMTVYENMAFGLKLRRFAKREIEQRVGEAAAMLEIADLLKRKPKELSGGQRQRVALGRAIVRTPNVFLFDEPLSNLDAKLRVQMRAEIKRLHRKLGVTMMYVTHDQVEAMTMGDRIAVMKDGIIHQIDSPMDLYRSPADMFVAGFIGSPSMNFVRGTFAASPARIVERTMEILLSDNSARRLSKHQSNEIVLGIRPEHVTLEPVNGREASRIEAVLESTELMGNESHLYCTAGSTPIVCRTHTAERRRHPGEQLTLYLDESQFFFFDPISGKTI